MMSKKKIRVDVRYVLVDDDRDSVVAGNQLSKAAHKRCVFGNDQFSWRAFEFSKSLSFSRQ